MALLVLFMEYAVQIVLPEYPKVFLGLYPSDDLRVVLHVHFVTLRWKISTMFLFSGFFQLFHSRACK